MLVISLIVQCVGCAVCLLLMVAVFSVWVLCLGCLVLVSGMIVWGLWVFGCWFGVGCDFLLDCCDTRSDLHGFCGLRISGGFVPIGFRVLARFVFRFDSGCGLVCGGFLIIGLVLVVVGVGFGHGCLGGFCGC